MLYVIVNPASKSGLGKRKWELLKQELNHSAIVYQVFFTDQQTGAAGCVDRLLSQIPAGAKAPLCVLGGDGTVNEVINALPDPNRFTLIYLPTGSSNDLARALHIESSPQKLIARIKNPMERTADSGCLTTPSGKKRRFCVSCGIGLDAAVCKEALHSKLKDTLNRLGPGKLTYAGIAFKQLLAAPLASCDLTLDGGVTKHFDKLLFAVAMIHPYEGGGIKMAPHADCQDGKFDIMVIAGLRKWRALYLLPLAFFGLHTKAKNVYFFQSGTLTVQTDVPLIVHTDGEYCKARKKIVLSCQKNGLKYH